jgi:Spy/CpxP family protein refolding chaperone
MRAIRSHLTTLAALGAALLLVAPRPAAAQAHHGHSDHAGKETREITALDDREVAALRAGEGMGFALPAELNSHPGPRHVLELAGELGLSAEQAAAVRRIFDEMRAEAVRLGGEYLQREREVDAFFAGAGTDEALLRAALAGSERARGEIRFAHLRAHLRTTALLTPHQIRHYDMLRGYRGDHH